MPDKFRVDNGHPWGSRGDLPCELALWLIGLGITMIWNRPLHPQENGVVERSHGVAKDWIEPASCRDSLQLKERLAWASKIQRDYYPVRGESRSQLHPQLNTKRRIYQPNDEDWQLSRVTSFLSQGLWYRKVDKNGRISIYNRPYTVGRRYATSQVCLRFDPISLDWLILDHLANEIVRLPSKEINREAILSLQVTFRKS